MKGVFPFQRLLEVFLYLLFFYLPFSIAVIETASIVLIAGWLCLRLNPKTRFKSVWLHEPFRGVLIGVLAFLVACLLSVFLSDHRALSIQGFIRKWLKYLMLMVVIADFASSKTIIKRSLLALAGGSGLVVFEAASQVFFGKGLLRGFAFKVYQRVTGPYNNPLDLGTFLVVVIPVLFIWALSILPGNRRKWGWTLLVLLFACLLNTEAIGAWLGGSVAILAVVLSSNDASVRRKGWLFVCAALLLGCLALWKSGRLSDTLSWQEIGKRDRVWMWQDALGMIRDRPLTGHGLNTFMSNYLDYWVGGERQPRYAHNCYLQLWAETGLVGLGAFCYMIWQLLVFLRNPALRDKQRQALMQGLVVGLLAFLIQAGVDTNFYSVRQAVLFWSLAGFALAVKSSEAGDLLAR